MTSSRLIDTSQKHWNVSEAILQTGALYMLFAISGSAVITSALFLSSFRNRWDMAGGRQVAEGVLCAEAHPGRRGFC